MEIFVQLEPNSEWRQFLNSEGRQFLSLQQKRLVIRKFLELMEYENNRQLGSDEVDGYVIILEQAIEEAVHCRTGSLEKQTKK